MRPCSTPDCEALANAAGVYCDSCDAVGMPNGWSRTRDAAWLAGKTTDEVNAIPLPSKPRLVLIQGGQGNVSGQGDGPTFDKWLRAQAQRDGSAGDLARDYTRYCEIHGIPSMDQLASILRGNHPAAYEVFLQAAASWRGRSLRALTPRLRQSHHPHPEIKP